jgi:hypothetical protein
MMISFLGGFTTKEEAETDLEKRVYKDAYTIASVFNMATEKDIAFFVIENAAVEVIMNHDERAHASPQGIKR